MNAPIAIYPKFSFVQQVLIKSCKKNKNKGHALLLHCLKDLLSITCGTYPDKNQQQCSEKVT